MPAEELTLLVAVPASEGAFFSVAWSRCEGVRISGVRGVTTCDFTRLKC
jgi:hypothetical protein